jgi:hypothetical protein
MGKRKIKFHLYKVFNYTVLVCETLQDLLLQKNFSIFQSTVKPLYVEHVDN